MKYDSYLAKKGKTAELHPHHPPQRYRCAVVIPALAESEALPRTLKSLASNSDLMLEDTMIMVVINRKPDAAPEVVEDNRQTIEQMREMAMPNLYWLDIVTEHGVGGARKTGMDTALQILDHQHDPLICCLDADTLVEADYLSVISGAMHRELRKLPGAVVDFRHKIPTDPALKSAVVEYELFMRYYVLGLHWAGSPYAFHSLGSAMVCRADSYTRCGGMRERNGGEDFYFMQALRKLGPIGYIRDTTIYPAGRLSDRVDFGTGPRLRKMMEGTPQEFYHFGVFAELKRILAFLNDEITPDLPSRIATLRPETAEFFHEQNFPASWEKIFRNTPKNQPARQAAFNTWLDGFRTLKLIHHLERTAPMLGRVSYRRAATQCLENYGKRFPESVTLPEILELFHDLERKVTVN